MREQFYGLVLLAIAPAMLLYFVDLWYVKIIAVIILAFLFTVFARSLPSNSRSKTAVNEKGKVVNH